MVAPTAVDTPCMQHLAHRYLTGRRTRGELCRVVWQGHGYVLAGFAATYGHRPPHRLARADIDRWAATQSRLAPATRRKNVAVVRGFCNWLVDQGIVAVDPMRGFRTPRLPRLLPRALPHHHVAAALEAAPDQRARLIIVLMVQQGLRCGEVAALQVGDVDLDWRQMRIVGKGGHERDVWVTDETVAELKLYLDEYPATGGPLVRSYQRPTDPLTPPVVGRIVRAALYAAHVKRHAHDGVSAHALRHTAATDMLRGGAHVRDVQAVLGHAHLVTTERYLPRLVGTLEQAMEGRTYMSTAINNGGTTHGGRE